MAASGRRYEVTARQLQVAMLVSAGHKNEKIASLLDLSPRTIETCRAELIVRTASRTMPEVCFKLGRGQLVSRDKRSTR